MVKLAVFFVSALLIAAVSCEEAGKADAAAAPETVVTLTTDSFDDFIAQDFVLVEFYAPWCGHCKKLAPEFEAAAKALEGKVQLGKVDATVESELATRFEVHGYPTLKAFRNGKAEDYKGGRTKDAIVSWIETMTGPSVDYVESNEAAAAVYESASVAFVGSFKSKTSDAAKVFEEVATEGRQFGKFVAIIAADAKDEVKVFRKSEGLSETAISVTDAAALKAFTDLERFPLFGPITGANFGDYFGSGRQLIWFAGSKTEFDSATKVVSSAAKQFRTDYNFVWLNFEEFKEHAESALGVKETPALVIQHQEGRYMFPESVFESVDKIVKFVSDVKDGKVERNLLSDPIPETNDEPVKVVVGKSFNDIVMQADKDVMLEVYAPWCGHCKKLEPIYNEFAENMKEAKHLVVAKMDGVKNESPNPAFQWNGFPTLFFVKAGSETPIPFEGPRTLEGLTEFVRENGSKPIDTDASKDEL